MSKDQKNRRGQRHLLIALSGTKPQIVTETLFALMVKKQPTVQISDVYLANRRNHVVPCHRMKEIGQTPSAASGSIS